MDKLDAALQVLQEYDAREIQNRGFHFQRNDYYSTLNDLQFLDSNRDLWEKSADPLDIDWNVQGQLDVARRASAFVHELRDVPQLQTGGRSHYCWNNDFWNNADALVQYGIVRDRKPKQYVVHLHDIVLRTSIRRSKFSTVVKPGTRNMCSKRFS